MASSEINYIFDAENAFRAPGLAALTASGVVGELPLDKLVNIRPGFNRGKLGAEGYMVILAVESMVASTLGAETYTFTVETGVAGAPAVAVATITVNGPGQYVVPLDAGTIEKLDADHEAIELNLAVDGTAPSIRFAAWLI